MFLGGLELDHALEAYATANSGALPSEGLLDCGATASAGPQVAIEGLISAVMAKDHQTQVEIQVRAPEFEVWQRSLGTGLVSCCNRLKSFGYGTQIQNLCSSEST